MLQPLNSNSLNVIHEKNIYSLIVCLFLGIGFTWQCFGAKEDAGITSVRRSKGLSLCWRETILANSKTLAVLPITDAHN